MKPDYFIEYDRKSDMVTFINRDEEIQNRVHQKEINELSKKLLK